MCWNRGGVKNKGGEGVRGHQDATSIKILQNFSNFGNLSVCLSASVLDVQNSTNTHEQTQAHQEIKTFWLCNFRPLVI